jgi:hypothetical protein
MPGALDNIAAPGLIVGTLTDLCSIFPPYFYFPPSQ